MKPASIPQTGEVLYATDLKKRIFEAALRTLRHPTNRWSLSNYGRAMRHQVNIAFERYAASVFAAEGKRPYTLPEEWQAVDTLIPKIERIVFFFLESGKGSPDWNAWEGKLLEMARVEGLQTLHVPAVPLEQVSAVLDIVLGPLEPTQSQ